MWGVHPRLMCDKHLMGEHVEMHMFVGTIAAGKSLDGYVRDKLVDPGRIGERHDELAMEMTRRGMAHVSPLHVPVFLTSVTLNNINEGTNTRELVRRCPDCRLIMEAELGKLWEDIPRGGDKVFESEPGVWFVRHSGTLLPGSYPRRDKALQALEKLRKHQQGGTR